MRFITTNYVNESATTITASSANINYPASNLKNFFRSKTWRSSGCVSESVVFDLQTPTDIDSVVLMWPKEYGIRLSDSAVIKVQANPTNVWTTPAIDITMTISNDFSIASHYFNTAQSYRYWRVLIEDATNPNGWVDLGVVFLGNSESIITIDNGFKVNYKDNSKIITTDYGNEYVDEYPTTMVMTIPFSVLDYSDIELIQVAYLKNGTRLPVLIVVDESSNVFNKDNFVLYGKMKSELDLTHISYDLFSTELEIREIV